MTLKHMYSTHSTVLEINHSGCFILRKLAWRSDIYISVKFVFVAACTKGSSDFDKIFENCYASCSFSER